MSRGSRRKQVKNTFEKYKWLCQCGLVFIIVLAAFLFGASLTPQNTLQENTNTTTTTETTTTTTPTTTIPATIYYHIKFSFVWGVDIAEEDKVWMEFAAYDYHIITAAGKRDQVTLAAGYGDTGEWFLGSWDEHFAADDAVSIAMESANGWYDFETVDYVDVTVGPWSHSFTFHSYKYGFSAFLTGELRVTWELVT